MRLSLRNVATRGATGAYILHAGWEKWTDGSRAPGVHGMAAGAYPFLRGISPTVFLKGLAAAELALGSAMLAPVVPNRWGGLGLTGFAGGLLAMYLRRAYLSSITSTNSRIAAASASGASSAT